MNQGDVIKGDTHANWLTLYRAPALGPLQQRALLDIFKSPAQILSAGTSVLEQHGLKAQTLKYLKQPDWKAVEADIKWLNQPRHHLVTYFDKTYPPLLKEIPDSPIVLFIVGDPEVLQSVQLGIVGSRNPSPGGKQIARAFAEQLAQLGITITSGMALGIDYCSHLGALDAKGRTIAILGNGLDIIYPARHKALAERIIDNGALVSEFPPGTPPLAENFPRRNRIISGLTAGILVVEAAQRSGSLITARYAMEQGREVFAIPGSIHNPLARGCHALIKQGAKLVETVQDILDESGVLMHAIAGLPNECKSPEDNINSLDEEYKLLLDNIAYEPVSVDKLIERTGLTADTVSSMLLILEIRGMVSSYPGGLYSRIS